jgi:hypothetical protein
MIVNCGWLRKIPYPISGKSKEYYVGKNVFSSEKETKLCITRGDGDARWHAWIKNNIS